MSLHSAAYWCARLGHMLGRNVYTGERLCFRCGTPETELALPTAPEAQP